MASALPKSMIAGAALLCVSTSAASLEYRFTAHGVRLQQLEVDRITAESAGGSGLRIDGVRYPGLGGLGSLELRCEPSPARCARGRLRWSVPGEAPIETDVYRDGLEFRLQQAGATITIVDARAGPELVVESVPLEWLRRLEPLRGRLAELSGKLSARVSRSENGLHGSLAVSDAGFDTPDGWAAGAALDTAVDIRYGDGGTISVDAVWSGGEWLFGPLYLSQPSPAIVVAARFAAVDGGWQFDRLSVAAGDDLRIEGSGLLINDADGWSVPEVDIQGASGNLAWAWGQGLRSLAAASGWGALEPSGRVTASLNRSDGRFRTARIDLGQARLSDGEDRISIHGLDAGARWGTNTQGLVISTRWSEARLYRVPLGPSRLTLRSQDRNTLVLAEPARIPVLDGALIVEELLWRNAPGSERDLQMAARLEPVDLAGLSERFGWPALGGRIAGRFPGLRLAPETVSLDGGLDLQLLGGNARVESLSIERPFGTDPALSADLRFDALDLDLFTQAFEIGRMQGLLSGSINGLRLLSWQPVAFDAWFETLDESPQREISQRAVDSLSSLSGGGGAAVSGILMRWFESFPYRKLGLGCRLSSNVCSMRGLRETGDGGYLILEGRAIPRLDIVGYQRRVDWPRLVAQMRAAVQSPGPEDSKAPR